MNILVALTKGLTVVFNLALLQFLWMLINRALLPQLGTNIPTIKVIGLSDHATWRAWADFRCGTWQTARLLRLRQVQNERMSS